jgi:alanine racemase
MISSIFPEISVNLRNIQENFLYIKEMLTGTKVAAVVKGNAYGLGIKKVCDSLLDVGCEDFWTSYLWEAVDIKNNSPKDVNVFVLQGLLKSDLDVVRELKIIPVVNSMDELEIVRNSGIDIAVHVDTGFSRIGLRPEDIDSILDDCALGGFCIKYVISHLACADEKSHELNIIQKRKFDQVIKNLGRFHDLKFSLSSSSGCFLGPEFHYDIVRIGAFLYGIDCGCVSRKPKNIVTMSARVLQRYCVPRGTFIGYGARFSTDREETKLAVLSVGYADGIPRSLSNIGKVAFYSDNQRYEAMMVGAISMDLLTCDVTDIPDQITDVHSRGFLLDDNYTINEMALDSGTIPYEILTGLRFNSERINLVYA